jgi:hypothetical protein
MNRATDYERLNRWLIVCRVVLGCAQFVGGVDELPDVLIE